MLITKIPGKDTDLKYLTSVKPKHSLYIYMNIKQFVFLFPKYLFGVFTDWSYCE